MNKVTQVLGNHKSTYLAQCSSIFVFQKAKNQKTYFSANSKQKRAKYYIFKVFQISYLETKAFLFVHKTQFKKQVFLHFVKPTQSLFCKHPVLNKNSI